MQIRNVFALVFVLILLSTFIVPYEVTDAYSGTGTFTVKPSISVKSDPAGHAQYINLQSEQLMIITSSQGITISGSPPWVNLSGTIANDGSFSASGNGVVAGFQNIEVTMSGVFQNGQLDGTLVMGGDGKLPTGQSISYSVTGIGETQSQPPHISSESTSVTIQNQVTNFNIPKWIKNNAKWWADGEIGDSEMMKALQYLISQEIITIPPTTQNQISSQSIPNWVKNDAQYWSQGNIDDSEFVKAIQYLVGNGIINVSSNTSKQPSQPLFTIDKKIVEVSVGTNSYATVTGKIPNYQRGDPIMITITEPDQRTNQLTIYAKSSGEFTTPIEFDQNSLHGTYSVTISYGVQNLGTVSLNLGEPGYVTSSVIEIPKDMIGCAGGIEAGDSHDFSWWNTQKDKFTTVENNLTILKQPTNTACGPTVGTVDLLHWNSTIAPGIVMGNVNKTINRLMTLMHYQDGWGTTNMTIAAGLSDYINMTGHSRHLKVNLYGKEYENGTTNTHSGTVNLVHVDVINSTILHTAMVQKSNVLVIIQSPDATRSHIMKLLAINDTQNSEGYYKVAFIDTLSGGIITQYMGDDGSVDYEGNIWYIVNIITVTPTVSK